ncbi:MAG: efflux RND transporter periplasmic adaptor subunit [Isosphaerales bacterium]
MRQSIPRELFGLASLVALAATTAGCGRAPAGKTGRETGPPVARVEVIRPERGTIRRSTVQPGQIEAYEVTAIYAKVSGYVRKWTVDIGTKVRKGEVLAVLSVPELDAEAEQKQAVVEESEAKLGQAKASAEVAQADVAGAEAKLIETRAGIKRADADLVRWQAEYKRVEQLSRDRAVTGSVLEETRSKLMSSESARDEVHAQVKTAEVAVRQGQAMLDKARSDVAAAAASIKVSRFDARRVQAMRGYETIAAPYDGVITHRNVDVGDLIEAGSRGQALFTVARDDLVRITVSVPEIYAIEVNPGDRALIHLQASAGKDFEGKVTRTSWTLDAKNRTLRTEIDVPNPKGTLRPGLYAYATIVVEEHAGALIVPITALVREDSQSFCVAVVDGRAVRQPVAVGLEDGTRAEILSGLEGKEAVVKAYAASLVEGQPLAVLEPEAAKAKR